MAEQQTELSLISGDNPTPAAPPNLREEIARAWGLPLGQRAEISFRGGQLDDITGTLELVAAPAYPWNPREPLQLRIAGFTFISRDIARWTSI